MAQLVEQLIRNEQVIGSSPMTGSILNFKPEISITGFFISVFLPFFTI